MPRVVAAVLEGTSHHTRGASLPAAYSASDATSHTPDSSAGAHCVSVASVHEVRCHAGGSTCQKKEPWQLSIATPSARVCFSWELQQEELPCLVDSQPQA